jgi:sRNA-binding regulator protein Hfq
MKKAILPILFFCIALIVSKSSFSQFDKIYLHNGKVNEGSVIRVDGFIVAYKFKGEDAEQISSKYAVKKIVYKSGREEDISEKVIVNGKDDWEKVVILENVSQISGLTKGGEIKGKTSMINYRSNSGSEKIAMRRLKEEAAEQGCPFVLITSDRGTTRSFGFGGSQDQKRGIAYKY